MKRFFQNKSDVLDLIILITLIFLPLLVIYKWFNDGSIIYFWDATIPLNPVKNLQDFYYLWKDTLFPGFSDPAWSWLPYVAFFYISNSITNSLSLSQALLYWILISSSLISFYYLAKTLLREIIINNKYIMIIIAFLGSILYTFNLYVFYYSFRIFNPQEFIISFLPLNFLALIKLYNLDGKDLSTRRSTITWIFVFFASLFLMTPGFSNLIFFLEYYLLIIFYLVFYLLIKRKFAFSFVTNMVFFLTAIFFFNFWWLFPMILALNDTFDAASSIGTNIYFILNSKLSTLINSMRLIGMPPMINPIFDWERNYINNAWFSLPLFVFPLLILFYAANLKKLKLKNLSIYFFIILTASIFLIKGENPPFSFITEFAFNKIPFFGVFRDSFHKAGLFFMFSYFMLVIFALGLLYEKVILMKKRLFIATSTIIALVAGTTIMVAPFFIFDSVPKLVDNTKNYSIEFSAKTKIPQEYFNLKPVIESFCKNEIVMVIPKTSILTSAYWGKDKSYIGQDVLHYLIDCSFIATQLSQNKPDSFTTAPYFMIQESDINTFKNYLLQNQINLLLVRQDYVSNRYTNLITLDIDKVKKEIGNDPDFEKIYENNFFSLFRFKKNIPSRNGFQVPSSIIYTNLSLNSANHFQILTRISSDYAALYINTLQNYEKYKNYINGYIFEANCIDCVEINIPKFQVSDNNDFVQRIKEFLKHYLKKNEEYSDDQKISIEIVVLNNKHALLLESLNQNDLVGANKNLDNYSAQLKKTYSLLKNFESDFFTVNNKKIEMKSFLNAQNKQMIAFFEKGNVKNNPFNLLRDEGVKENYIAIISEQALILEELKRDIYGTDYLNRAFRLRLDIPKSGDYMCFADVRDKDMVLSSLKVNDYIMPNLEGINELYLSEGSHRVEMSYSDMEIFNSDLLSLNEKTNELKIGRLVGGNYTIRFKADSEYNEKPFEIIISKGKLNSDLVKTIKNIDININKVNSIIFRDVVLDSRYVGTEYSKRFIVEEVNGEEDYYIYFIPHFQSYPNSIYSNLIIEKTVKNDDLGFYCYTGFADIKKTGIESFDVEKVDTTEYKLKFPRNFSSGFITFNQSFNDSWKAYSRINSQIHAYDHIKSGYSNVWFIDSNEDGEVNIVFSRQKVAEKAAIVGIILFIITIVMFVYVRTKSLSWGKQRS